MTVQAKLLPGHSQNPQIQDIYRYILQLIDPVSTRTTKLYENK